MTKEINSMDYLIYAVEDNEVGYLLFKKYLELTKYNYKIFRIGRELLSAVERKTPDLLILDICLPYMTAFDILAELVSKEKYIPTVLITAHDCKEFREEMKKYDILNLLRKPILFNSFFEMVQVAFHKKRKIEVLKRMTNELPNLKELIDEK